MTPVDNTPEMNPMDPELERAVSEIRDEAVDPAVIEAAAARVWSNLASHFSAPHLRTCADFQTLIPAYRTGQLNSARATLLQDHLHECVACRKVYEGRAGDRNSPSARLTVVPRRTTPVIRWAIAAGVVAATGISVWIAAGQFGGPGGRAIVQTVNGTLYEISASGIRPLAAGQPLPEGVELRTATASNAVLELRDGSTVELRERSGLQTGASGRDLTIRLNRGSIIVQAAHRSSGHLFVSTADCRVAVTGTVFSVSAGIKGSRVSVVQGEVHVSRDNQEKILHPGEQTVTSDTLEPVSVRDDISWSRDRDHMLQQLDKLRSSFEQIHLPALRYSSRLLGKLPSSTFFFASIPNLTQYLTEAQTVFQKQMAESPELRDMASARGLDLDPVLAKLHAANEYLGDEIAVVVVANAHGPVFLAETKRDGFAEFLKREIPPAIVVSRPGLVVFGPDRAGIETVTTALDSNDTSFQQTAFYARINQAYQRGVGLLLCADLSNHQFGPRHQGMGQAVSAAMAPPRFIICEQKEVSNQMVASASLGYDGPRAGIASWLAEPSPMGSLDYVSPEATLVGAFVFKSPAAIVDEVAALVNRSPAVAEQTFTDIRRDAGFDARTDLAATLGGEFSLSMDGPIMPVPSWKLVIETYDPGRLQSTLEKIVDAYNRDAVKNKALPVHTGQETVDGRVYYMIAGGDGSPLTEAHYTFAGGYMIAGPTRALVQKALQTREVGASITHSTQFVSLTPRDHFANFSAILYQNLGTTLKPLVGLLGAFAPQGHLPQGALQGLGNIKPMMIAAYGEPDRITVTSNSNVLSTGMTGLVTGDLGGVIQTMVPFQLPGMPDRTSPPRRPSELHPFQLPGTLQRQPALKY